MDGLIDIYNEIKLKSYYYFDEIEQEIFIENVLHLLDYFIKEDEYKEILYYYDDFKELILSQFDNDIWFDICDENEEYIDLLLDYCYEVYTLSFVSNNNHYDDETKKFYYNLIEEYVEPLEEEEEQIKEFILDFNSIETDNMKIIENLMNDMLDYIENNNKNDTNLILEYISLTKEKMELLRNVFQPKQRTPEWYEYRNNLISASNAYKALGTQSDMNSLIYEKCMPLKNYNNSNININSPLHFGQKYEPVSVMLYEKLYNTKIEDFGCIRHKTYQFLGASPDGINSDITSSLFGRMLEIKNVVSRIITGIPKKEYWIQMQLQMECCDLNETDFLETKFIEYENEEAFLKDGDFLFSNDNKPKGIILVFYKNGTPYYEYKPIDIDLIKFENYWFDEIIDKNYDKTFIDKIYWKLDVLSCVLVKRDREWFNNNIANFERVWNIILDERKTGEYVKRAPQKRIKKIDNIQPELQEEKIQKTKKMATLDTIFIKLNI